MKSFLALALIALALSLCSLFGRRNNGYSNINSNTQSNANENSNAGVPQMENPSLSAPTPKPNHIGPVSGGVLNGKATYLPKPAYPPIAKAAHASGIVNVQVMVDENGNVISANAVSGHPMLQAAAVAAARQAKFTPTKLAGRPVKVTGVLIYNFVEQ